MAEKPLILFDGICNFCNGAVNFIIKQDRNNKILFAALQSHAGQQILKQHHLSTSDFKSLLLIYNNKVYQKSSATLKLLSMLPWYWKWTQIFWIIPTFLRNSIYDVIARNRYKWFGRKDKCMIPDATIRNRFLD
jgi:predicted DCC family thiol-disulfide oxidoreductase YuxK